jgi:hypothetical protein
MASTSTPSRISKARQQDVVADFVDDHDLEHCMFVYLDAFIDAHIANYPNYVPRWDADRIYAILEMVYKGLRDDLAREGMLTKEAASEYLHGEPRGP